MGESQRDTCQNRRGGAITEGLRNLVLEVVREVISWGNPKCPGCKRVELCEAEDFMCLEGLEAGLEEIYVSHRLTSK